MSIPSVQDTPIHSSKLEDNVVVYQPPGFLRRAIHCTLKKPFGLILISVAGLLIYPEDYHYAIIIFSVVFAAELTQYLIWLRKCITRIEFGQSGVRIDYVSINTSKSVTVPYEQLTFEIENSWHQRKVRPVHFVVKANGRTILSQFELKHPDREDMEALIRKLAYFKGEYSRKKDQTPANN